MKMTRIRIRIAGVMIPLLGSCVYLQAQSAGKVEAGASFDYARTNVLPGCRCVDMFGGGGEILYGLSPRMSLLGNLDVVQRGGITPDGYDLKQLTWGAGLRFRPIMTGHRTGLFVDLLAGSAHAFGTLSPSQTGFGSSDAFAFQTGVGVDIQLNHRWSIEPARIYYVLTTFSNGGANRQNDLTVSTGLRFLLQK